MSSVLGDCMFETCGFVNSYGYRRLGHGGRRAAHREAYERAYGPIPSGFHVHHVCGVRECVNPDHLQALSPGDHNRVHRHWEAPNSPMNKQAAATHCVHGHEFTPENTGVHAGKRFCRACNRRRCREYHARNRERINARKRVEK